MSEVALNIMQARAQMLTAMLVAALKEIEHGGGEIPPNCQAWWEAHKMALELQAKGT